MNEHRRIPVRSVIGYCMAALSQALFVSGTLAVLLYPSFHGYLERTDTGNSFWVEYFTIGGLRVDHRAMFAGFIIAFVLLPIMLGVWLALRSTQPRFQFVGPFLGFGFLIALALAFNLWVAAIYLFGHWNSSEPF